MRIIKKENTCMKESRYLEVQNFQVLQFVDYIVDEKQNVVELHHKLFEAMIQYLNFFLYVH